MRIGVLEQVKTFLKNAKINDSYVYISKEIKLTIKNYLIKEKMLYSPMRGIYILKKHDQFNWDVLSKYKYEVIQKLWWVLTGKFAIAQYLWDISQIKSFKIITKSKSFKTNLWDNIYIEFVASKVPRIIKKLKIENSELQIEDALSLYINNYKNIPENSEFIRYLMNVDIDHHMVEYLIKNKFKLSGISKLALLYKQNWFTGKHKTIINTLRQAGKQIDYRKARTQVSKNKTPISTSYSEDLDSLI